MRKIALLSYCLVVLQHSSAQTNSSRQIDNLTAFAKLYGYVRYFHPSDEAASIDWNRFAMYGSMVVMAAGNEDDLLLKLQGLFYPIAPSVKIYKTTGNISFDIKDITPPKARDYKVIVWQHYGIDLGMDKSIYKSYRVNRPNPDANTRKIIFKTLPAPGEIIQKSIAKNITVAVPLALYGNETATWPEASKTKLQALKDSMLSLKQDISGNELMVRLGNIIIAWNIFKHFFPYWEDASADPTTILQNALDKSLKDKTALDFVKTLQLMTAPLNDGHIGVWLKSDTGHYYTVPLLLDWAENQLVVEKVLDKELSAQIAPGDIIKSIDGVTASEYIKDKQRYFSGSLQYKQARLIPALLSGYKNTTVNITVQQKGHVSNQTLQKSFSMRDVYKEYYKKKASGFLSNNIFYVDINNWPMDSVTRHLGDLKNAKAIICDLRGYPNSNHELISYLLDKDEDSKWMFVPEIIYPDFEKVLYDGLGWAMHAKKPHLNGKIIFITDGRAISYAESYMGYIKDFKLATIIGMPTAGTNGNINIINLPGGYGISFTGMLVKNHDGSKHHLKGILPDVFAVRTIGGITAGKDELLQKAIQLAGQ